MLKYFLLIFLSLNAFAENVKDFNKNEKNYDVGLKIFDGASQVASFKVAVAKNFETQKYGLMNLKKLDEKNGMFFVFEKRHLVAMWMKDTYIALDMIFIDNDKIVAIKKDATPLSLEVISSGTLADAVLEINAGLVEKYNIKIGQKVKYENF